MRFHFPSIVLALVLAMTLSTVAATASAAPSKKTEQVTANPIAIAIYSPPSSLTARAYLPTSNIWAEPGKALADALKDVGAAYFPNHFLVPTGEDRRYALLVDLAPKWTPAYGKVDLTLAYDVYDAAGTKLHSGKVQQVVPVKGGNFNAAAYNASRMTVQRVMADLHRRYPADPAKYPDTGVAAKIDPGILVDRSEPYRTGTAFFINKQGQMLTAAHVSRDCVLMEARQGETVFPVTARASSDLLDVAVLDSGKPRAAALPFRVDQQIVLGESITSVGYPLRGLLGDSPNLTRGNISASKGLKGSWGMFQFSAPTQPGNSGGPIVSDNGEVLGVTVTTLSAEWMVKQGLIPQNINFALDARHVAAFLRKENVAFDTVKPQGAGSMQIANDAALSNTFLLNCYQ